MYILPPAIKARVYSEICPLALVAFCAQWRFDVEWDALLGPCGAPEDSPYHMEARRLAMRRAEDIKDLQARLAAWGQQRAQDLERIDALPVVERDAALAAL